MNQNSIEIVTAVFAAGESRLWGFSGEYFEIIEAPNPIDVTLSEVTGAQRARMSKASASFYSKGVQYGVIQITSAAAQTIRFAYGTGETGTRRSTGSVTVSGAIALDSATLAALKQINVRPEAPSGSFAQNGALAANTPEIIFTPELNVNGAVLLNADLAYWDNTSTVLQVLISKASAPNSVVDGQILLSSKPAGLGSSMSSGATLPKELYIAAGLGLYHIANVAMLDLQTLSLRACRYKLL